MPAGVGYAPTPTVTRNDDGSVTFALPANQSGTKPRGHGGYRTERHDYFAERAAKRADAAAIREVTHPHTRPPAYRQNVQPQAIPEEVIAPLIQNTPPQIGMRSQQRRNNDLTSFLSRFR